MSSPIIPEGDLDYRDEYDPMHEVFYGGIPFTGTAQAKHETTEYVDGKAHGQSVSRYKSGRLQSEYVYVAGECVSGRSWYEDGTPRTLFEAHRTETSKWDRDGILAYQAADDATGIQQTRWFYKDGTVKQHVTVGQGTDYFASDGRLAMRVTYRRSLNLVRYVDDVLETSYLDVLTHYYVDATLEKSSVEWYFWGWVWRMLSRKDSRSTALTVLNHLNAAKFDTARLILEKIKRIDLDTFKPALSYHIDE